MVIIMSSKQPNLNNILMKQAMRKAIDNINFIDSIYYQHSAYIKLKKIEYKNISQQIIVLLLRFITIYDFSFSSRSF